MSARRWVLSVLVALLLWPAAVNGQSPGLMDAVDRFGDLFNQGRYEEALPFAEEAIRLAEDEFGFDHPAIAAYLRNLAALYANQAKYVEAEALYQRVLAILEKAFGPEHREVVKSRDYLALVYRAQGKQAEAAEMVARAKAIRTPELMIEEVHRGVVLIALPPYLLVKYDVSLIPPHEGLANARKALDVIYQESPFSADTLETLKKNGEVVIVYDPSYPWTEFATLKFSRFMPEVPNFLLSAFPDIFIETSGGKGEKIFLVVLGRHIIKHPPHELAAGIVHELVGHGIQHLHGRLDVVRELDLECEAWLYQLNAFQDFKVDKFSREMIQFRQELEGYNCDDFKRYMREHQPSLMPLWDEVDIDVPRVLAVFEDYLQSDFLNNLR